MTISMDVTGADFARVSTLLRQFDPQLQRDLAKAIRAAAKPVMTEMKTAVRATSSTGGSMDFRRSERFSRTRVAAPRGKGLRAAVARSVRVTQRDRGRNEGVKIYSAVSSMGTRPRLPMLMDRGSWSHPVFGRGRAWQTFSPEGWFTTTAERNQERFVRAVTDAVRDAAEDLARRLSAAG